MSQEIKDIVRKKDKMTQFQAVAWDGQDQDDQFVIRIFGRSEDGRSVSLGTRFNPFFYVKISRDVKDLVRTLFWRGLVSCETVRAKDLWGFQNGELSTFLKLEFKTHKALRNCSYCIENTKYPELTGCKVYESNIDPVLRFMHVSGISSTGWIDPGMCEPDTDSTCQVALWNPNWRDVTPVWRDDIAPFRIMSFDIECYSSTGAFPNPLEPNDVVFQIGMTTKEFGKKEYLDRKCLCLKKTSGSECESFETESDLLEAFERYLAKIDPDILTGWNIFGFDLEFLFVRATIHCKQSPIWGRIQGSVAELVEKNLSSSALGNNVLKMVPMKGRYVFDLFQDVKREHKLESYSLNNVSKHFLKDQKNDMPVREMFKRYREGDPDKLGEVADYCIKDTELPHALMEKLCQIQNQVEMAKACWVPLSFLSERGQQIKVFSQMAKKARELKFIIPTIRANKHADETDDGYQGATVLKAQTGAYYNPITALDFASLYPSIMCAHNMCYSTLVMDPKYDNLPGVTYERFGPYTFAQSPAPSLLPVILTDLKAFRKKAKKDMAQAEGTPMESIYNGKQLAYKISMNSIYGFTGASKGMLPCVAIASSVTMQGRNMIETTKNYVEENFPGAKVRYGDSVTGNTPVTVRKDGKIYVIHIGDLGGFSRSIRLKQLREKFQNYKKFKNNEKNEKAKRDDPEYQEYRHLSAYGGPLYEGWKEYEGFLKEGSNKEMLELDGIESWTHLGWKPIKRIIRHKCNKKIYGVLTPSGYVEVTEDHSLLSPSLDLLKPTDVKLGDKLYHSFPEFDGEINVGWNKIDEDILSSVEKVNRLWPRKRTSSGFYGAFNQLRYLSLCKLGLNVTICRDGAFSWTDRKWNRHPHEIVKIYQRDERSDRYVYDLETEAGTFQAGIGQMIVKNTDSVMVEFDVQGRKGQDAIDYSWIQGELAAEQCTKLFKAPNDLELEKVYCPYFLYSKKRYAAKMYEKKGDRVVFKKIDVKGLQVVRRDSCAYVRETLKKLLEMILETSDPMPVIHAAREAAQKLMSGAVPIEKLTLSKQLAAEYKVPMAHVTVRDKIRERAPGSEPQQGDRVSFVIVKGDGKMFEKAEDPVWVREHNTPLDYQYYFSNQFKKPVQDLLEPLVSADIIFDKKFMVKTTSSSEVEARKAFLERFTKPLKKSDAP